MHSISGFIDPGCRPLLGVFQARGIRGGIIDRCRRLWGGGRGEGFTTVSQTVAQCLVNSFIHVSCCAFIHYGEFDLCHALPNSPWCSTDQPTHSLPSECDSLIWAQGFLDTQPRPRLFSSYKSYVHRRQSSDLSSHDFARANWATSCFMLINLFPKPWLMCTCLHAFFAFNVCASTVRLLYLQDITRWRAVTSAGPSCFFSPALWPRQPPLHTPTPTAPKALPSGHAMPPQGWIDWPGVVWGYHMTYLELSAGMFNWCPWKGVGPPQPPPASPPPEVRAGQSGLQPVTCRSAACPFFFFFPFCTRSCLSVVCEQ